MKGYGKLVRDQLLAGNCWFVRHGKGDHDIWMSPNANRPLTVPVNIDSRHTANKVMKDAGLSHRF